MSNPNHNSLRCQSCCQSEDGNAVSCCNNVRGDTAPARAVHYAPHEGKKRNERDGEEKVGELPIDPSNFSQNDGTCWDRGALELHLNIIPMLLRLSTVSFDTFIVFYQIDLSTSPIVVDIICSKSTELTVRDSQNAQEIISLIKAIPFNVRHTFSLDVFRQITAYSTHKLEVYFRELRRHVNIIIRYFRKVKSLQKASPGHSHHESIAESSHMHSISDHKASTPNRTQAKTVVYELETLIEKVCMCEKRWRGEDLRAVCSYSEQLTRNVAFLNIIGAVQNDEVQESRSKILWLLRMFGTFYRQIDECWKYFQQGQNRSLLSPLRLIAVNDSTTEDDLMWLCDAISQRIKVTAHVCSKLPSYPLKHSPEGPNWCSPSVAGVYFDVVLRCHGLGFAVCWMHIFSAEIKVGLHMIETNHKGPMSFSQANYLIYPYGRTCDSIDESWSEVSPALLGEWPGKIQCDICEWKDPSTLPIAAQVIEALWAAVFACMKRKWRPQKW